LDPPWKYGNVNTGGSMNSGSENKYPTMSLAQLMDFDIPSIAAIDSVIFMWCTVQMTPDALQLLAHWGFRFNGMIFWHKTGQKGLGFWWSNVVEFIMFGVKGKVKPFRSQLPNFLELPSLRHSEKPPEFRKLIENFTQYMPDRKMIEVFARHKVDGWKYHGNQLLEEKM
jgi:N6-adenosine-specific RNA methylase IME4